jgi:dienelactone hydrolase
VRVRSGLVLLVVLLAVGLGALPVAHAQATTTTHTGTLADGASWQIRVPADWNGTLLLYSHGYRDPSSPTNPAQDVSDPVTGGWLLDHGFALAGSSYASTGWAVKEALADQAAVLDEFEARVGRPRHTIAWGDSLGGMVTAGLVQRIPERLDGALPACGVVAGAVATWNQALDAAFAFKVLLAPDSDLRLVHIADPAANLALARQVLAAAQATEAGRARLALVAALNNTPGWADPTGPEPAPDAYATRQLNQYAVMNATFPFPFAFRAELEARAGGNPSWNLGVDYARQLQRSVDRDEVEALYRQAGLDLAADLRTLNRAPRIAPDLDAVGYAIRNIVFNGRLGGVPVLTLHTTGDPLVVVQQERAYAQAVRAAGDAGLLRQAFVHRAGHCSFTPAERIGALQALLQRVDSGGWGDATTPERLNATAEALGPLNVLLVSATVQVPTPPAFLAYTPGPYLRPFNLPPFVANVADPLRLDSAA